MPKTFDDIKTMIESKKREDKSVVNENKEASVIVRESVDLDTMRKLVENGVVVEEDVINVSPRGEVKKTKRNVLKKCTYDDLELEYKKCGLI